ncbi:hypothetical protein L7F22_006515 [Adiantum nelumboides]|nr:hypothetical protein [Adiantum nelumboides]
MLMVHVHQLLWELNLLVSMLLDLMPRASGSVKFEDLDGVDARGDEDREILDRPRKGEEVFGAVGMVFELPHVCDAIIDGADASTSVGVVLRVRRKVGCGHLGRILGRLQE